MISDIRGVTIGLGFGFLVGVGIHWITQPAPRGPAYIRVIPGGEIKAGIQTMLTFCGPEPDLISVKGGAAQYPYDYGISRPDDLNSEVRGVYVDCGMLDGPHNMVTFGRDPMTDLWDKWAKE